MIHGTIEVMTRSQVYDARTKTMCLNFRSIFIGDLRSSEAAKTLREAKACLPIETIIVKGRLSSRSTRKNLQHTDDIARNAS